MKRTNYSVAKQNCITRVECKNWKTNTQTSSSSTGKQRHMLVVVIMIVIVVVLIFFCLFLFVVHLAFVDTIVILF